MYTNPIFGEYFADPFVLAYRGLYFAYGTAPSTGVMQFPILCSSNLRDWERVGWALDPQGLDSSTYWAPEVVEVDGCFYMYYSAGIQDKRHQIRVATSASPTGPFQDSGSVLTPDLPFAIDPHPFRDRDGQWYLFYARDFLNIDGDYRAGTGIVVDRMASMVQLEGLPQVVVRPFAEWQLFQKKRAIYDGVYDWYTIEGPSLRVHKDCYYCFYSGGAWERSNYGVSYVVADHPLGPYKRPLSNKLPLMTSVPGRVIGPGHNSFVTTQGGQEWIVYHGWDVGMTARLMRMDRLQWSEDNQPILTGPSWTPQALTLG